MPDDIDRAQDREQQLRDDALAEHARRAGIRPAESLERCRECGEIIPDQRRAAVPGCALCAECQEWAEYVGRRQRA